MSSKPVAVDYVQLRAILPPPQVCVLVHTRRSRLLALILLTLASTEFVFRGPVRFFTEGFAWNDFIAPFVQTRLWLSGSDPYSPKELVRAWPADAVQFSFLKNDLADGTLVAKRGVPSPYPPSTFALLTPLAHLSWRAAHIALLVLMLVSVAMILCAAMSLAQIRSIHRRALLMAITLALAPLHTAIATGNIALPAFACGIGGLWMETRLRPYLAGILIAVSACLKPPIGLVFLAYYFFRCEWRVVLTTAAAGAAVLAVSVGRMMNHTRWLGSYMTDSASLFGIGAINDFTTANPLHFQLVNLQGPLFSLLGTASAANVFARMIAAVLFVLWIGFSLRERRTDNPLLMLSTLTIIAMLPIYHRFVDAVVIVLPLCWAFSQTGDVIRRTRLAVSLCIAPFLVPGAAILSTAASQHWIPRSMTMSAWWQAVILSYQVWAIFGLALILLAAMAQEASTQQLRKPPAAAPMRNFEEGFRKAKR